MDIKLIGLVVLGLLLVIILIYGYYQRQQDSLAFINTPRAGYKNRKGFWWYRNLYRTNLPDVAIYGESDKKQVLTHPAVITSEYPIAQQLQTGHLGEHSYPYQAKLTLLSVAEMVLFNALQQALQRQPYILLAKVHLAEVLETIPDLEVKAKRIALERLRQKRLDFVICSSDTASICGVIAVEEVFDAEKPLSTQLHDKFVDKVLETANIPIVHIVLREQYDSQELQAQLTKILKLSLQAVNTVTEKLCPTCGATMKRVSPKNGQYAGRHFLACSHYPQCKTVFPL
ncbi:DUF2726 domain-containing protein [Beggiatoa leptomitoformis]|nr:DUF2726 domain-containing protein [Beggiatoa leptomitoformis]